MYKFHEKFDTVNDIKMPYSVTEENLHQYTNPPGYVENGRFFFAREHTRLVLKTPKLKNFDFKCKVGFVAPACAFNNCISWAFYFGYDLANRVGKMLSLSYFEKDATLNIQLYDVCGKKTHLIAESISENVKLDANKMYDFEFSVKDGKCIGCFDYIGFSFECTAVEGRVAFANNHSIKELLFSDIYIESDSAEYEVVLDKNYVIPHYNGGSENYCMHISVKKYTGGTYAVSYELTGGAYSRKTPDYKMRIWSVQYDIITNAYIRFYGKKDTDKFYLKNGELHFVEQNETFKETQLILNGDTMPYVGSFYLEEFDEKSDFAFGYDMFRRLGNELQEGKREFVYRQEELIYSGTSLADNCLITIESPKDKKITKSIPKNIDKYENALFHAQNNHYFRHDEDVLFKITTHIRKNADLTTVRVYLLDAFFNEIKELIPSVTQTEKFSEFGFTTLEHNINLCKMPQAVYHIKAEILLGSEILQSHTSAFEVLDDSEITPRESSGIPFMYSGEAAPANIEYNCPDPWMIKPDHNEVHYLDCMLAVPEITENRNGWEILKLYKRKMFLWADYRTIPREKSYEEYPKSLKLADYLSINDTRAPILHYNAYRSTFESEAVRKIYNDFKEEHKEYNLFDMPDDGNVSEEVYVEFFKNYGTQWVNYLCEKNAHNLMALNDSIRKKYPQIKFSHYGPYNTYTTRHSGIRRTKLSYKPYEHAHEMMDGFWIFEDYPFITGQATHYSAWGMMGLLLNMPKANVIVELFGNFDPVCPDGFVCYAFPPMGEVYVESYRTVTQVYEHMYAAVFKDGDFRYYSKPGFQLLQSYNTEAGQRFEDFLKGWYTYLKNKPARPMKSAVFIAEFPEDDDRFDFDFSERDANNISQAGQAYLYEIMAESGLPKGFCTNLEGVLSLNKEQTDVCVLPSLKHSSDEIKQKLRALSEEGVALIAVSDVSDLCDLFGVKEDKKSAKVAVLERGSEREIITQRNAEFMYSENGAETVLYAVADDGKKYPFVLKYGKNILINSYICRIGCADFYHDSFGIANVSKLFRRVLTQVVTEVSAPLATSDENCGLNLFVTENGEKRILLTDFTLCKNSTPKEVTVKLNFDVDKVENVCHKDMAVQPNIIRIEGKVKAFTVTLRPGESTMFAVE